MPRVSSFAGLPMLALASLVAAGFAAVQGGARGQAPGSAGDRERAWRANNIGVAALEQYNYDAAAQSFREALRIQPDLGAARLNLAIALFYGNHTADAAAETRTAVARLRESPNAHYMLGLIARAQDRLDDAVAAFGRVLTIDPSDAGARVQLGQIRLQRREYAPALQLFQEALAAEPYNVTAAYNAALALMRGGRADEGQNAMQRFESLRDSSYGVTYSQAYLAQGRYAEAIASTGAEPELVDQAVPTVTFTDATKSAVPAAGAPQTPSAASAGALTLFDADGDGDLDAVDVGAGRLRWFRNEGGRFTDATSQAGFDGRGGRLAAAGDIDNDGRPDLVVSSDNAFRLMRQTAGGTFTDATPAGLPRPPATTTAIALADVDHDGDLDIVSAGTALQLLRNNGNGTFADISAPAGLTAPLDRPVALAATDVDNRRDIDLLVADAGRGPRLFRNMRDGSFREASAELNLAQVPACSALAIADINKDGFPDAFFGRTDEAGVLALSDGRGKFQTSAAPPATRGARLATFVDYDNDGLLDLVVATDRRVHLLRNLGRAGWSDVSSAARLDAVTVPDTSAFDAMALGDLDSDGDADLLLRDTRGLLRVMRNDGGNRHASQKVGLAARVSNRSGLGAKVEIRSGSLRQVIETSSASPAVAAAGVLFGLGARTSADVVRVLWPSGILQAETSLGSAPGRARATTVTELDRKPSSCPYLFTWNGTRFEFITDFMGGGEMGDWLAPSVWNQPDPDEYVRIRGDQLKEKDGRFELRVTNELEEALFLDRVQLVAVDHPADVDVFPNEGLKQPPRPPFTLIAVRGARSPHRATDEHGHDVLPQIAALDRRYPDDFTLLPIRGYAAPHALTLDLGAVDRPILLMTGWTDYAFSSDNVAAAHGGIEMALPSLQVRDASGAWRTVIEEIGFPVGRPQTIPVDLTGRFLSASREVRILTSMRIYWDQVRVASADDTLPRLTRLDPLRADLAWRGFSAESTPDGREPLGYDYQRVSTMMPWKTLIGRYTRAGDVRPLLRAVDDLFVISRPGDELSLAFDASAVPARPAGWARTFLLFAHGYSKEMNPRSATTDVLGPLPFSGMTSYPYGPAEHYPRTPAHREYLDRYNTRVVTRVLPSIDAAMIR